MSIPPINHARKLQQLCDTIEEYLNKYCDQDCPCVNDDDTCSDCRIRHAIEAIDLTRSE